MLSTIKLEIFPSGSTFGLSTEETRRMGHSDVEFVLPISALGKLKLDRQTFEDPDQVVQKFDHNRVSLPGENTKNGLWVTGRMTRFGTLEIFSKTGQTKIGILSDLDIGNEFTVYAVPTESDMLRRSRLVVEQIPDVSLKVGLFSLFSRENGATQYYSAGPAKWGTYRDIEDTESISIPKPIDIQTTNFVDVMVPVSLFSSEKISELDEAGLIENIFMGKQGVRAKMLISYSTIYFLDSRNNQILLTTSFEEIALQRTLATRGLEVFIYDSTSGKRVSAILRLIGLADLDLSS